MQSDPFEVLSLLAELAVGLVGFSGIVLAIRGTLGLIYMMTTAVMLAVLAVLPFALLSLGLRRTAHLVGTERTRGALSDRGQSAFLPRSTGPHQEKANLLAVRWRVLPICGRGHRQRAHLAFLRRVSRTALLVLRLCAGAVPAAGLRSDREHAGA